MILHYNKYLLSVCMFIFSCSLCIQQAMGNDKIYSEEQIVDLCSQWQLRQVGEEQWIAATVPGVVQQDLLKHQIIPNPFWGTNEKDIQWVENHDWEYKTSFEMPASLLEYSAAQLIFEGLDTYAEVYLNGSHILSSNNMFVGHTVNVREVLHEGVNRLHILFRSPITKTLPQFHSNGFNYPAANDHHEKHLSVFTRKAPYSYGWDWGIRMVTMGIWRPIKLKLFNLVTVNDYYVEQVYLSEKQAHINHHIEIFNTYPSDTTVTLSIDTYLKDKHVGEKQKEVVLRSGVNTITISDQVDNPQYWMPNGWGDPTRYKCQLKVGTDKGNASVREQYIGFRDIKLIQEPDSLGSSFYFLVNGNPLFAKGANYIPQDAMLPTVSKEQYKQLFERIKASHMNMIRVWGGGVYEEDIFYELADEYGILIWQDFMFACTPYPADPSFLNQVKQEVAYNVKRLRSRPSIALWCGNNEVLECIKYWGINKQYSADIYNKMQENYRKLFCETIPSTIALLDTTRTYIHGSPLEANWGRPHTWGKGDSHNWGVWYGRKPFESLKEDIPRFMSEFGFQAFPEMKTINTFAPESEHYLHSPTMKAHQKSSIGNELIQEYMQRDYTVPKEFDDFVYVGLVMQGAGMRMGIEAHRRNKPYCMGTLYWQLNDSWPVVSWSSIDYWGNAKALYYQAKRAFSPIMLSVDQQADELFIYLVSDELEARKDLTLCVEIKDFFGNKIPYEIPPKRVVEAKANSTIQIDRVDLNQYIKPSQKQTHYAEIILLDAQNNEVAHAIHFFDKTKELQLPNSKIHMKQSDAIGYTTITLWSDTLCKDVFVETPIQGVDYSDNFFHLQPKQPKTIILKSPYITPQNSPSISIRHMAEIK